MAATSCTFAANGWFDEPHRSVTTLNEGPVWAVFTRDSSSFNQGFGALVKRALNSSSDRRKPSFVSTTDFALPTGSRMSPFSGRFRVLFQFPY
jgi:hypothetical protein